MISILDILKQLRERVQPGTDRVTSPVPMDMLSEHNRAPFNPQATPTPDMRVFVKKFLDNPDGTSTPVQPEIENRPTGGGMMATPTPQQQAMPTAPMPQMTPEEYQQAVLEGFKQYGGGADLPAAAAAPDFARVMQLAETDPRYAIFKRYPFLLPAISIKETSAGKHMAGANNPLNWGIHEQQSGAFNPQSMGDVIDAAASGIAYRTPASGYEKFRNGGTIDDFLSSYAPPSENDTNLYSKQLKEFMSDFEQAASKKKKK